MRSLTHKLVALLSALIIVTAVVVLPGCKKSTTPAPKKEATKKVPSTGME